MVAKNEDFWEWYSDIIEQANLSDKRYPVKGLNVWTPYGWGLILNMDQLIRDEMAATNHDEVMFPLLIPETEFAKEAEHIKGFNQEVYWVTHAGETPLDVRLLLRPTSETAMYPMFALWIRSHADLPLKIFQLVNTFRYETKQTRSFIRVREIHFFEAHTCHVDFEDAERQINEDLEIADRFLQKLCLPHIITKRPDWDKFAGAHYSLGIDTLMPTGRTLQLGSIHQYRQNFSRAYEITYETETGEHEYAYQTTYGMSERLLGAIVGVHGDDRGLILPPDVASVQVVIIPIYTKDNEEMVLKECEKAREALISDGLRVRIDTRDTRPGSKYYDWELRGVPLRIELGPKDIEAQQVVMVRRDTGDKTSVSLDNMVEGTHILLEDIAESLLERAQKTMESRITDVRSMEDLSSAENIIRVPWCGSEACGQTMEETSDMSMLGEPLNGHVPSGMKCPVCDNDAPTIVLMARAH